MNSSIWFVSGVNDHRGEHGVALVSNLQIGGKHEGRVHWNHVTISSDINHVQSIERCR